ncbi:hypothetical protein BB561_001243 [Smittium simulii]|uniref:Homoserine dehydrogenase n=1 Tax=Smittium simulii TaxID=133385 RepID=A0A2T9YVG8_9FUNG|nr:hypothetical protein BB561_001243 [Smittium simulii]
MLSVAIVGPGLVGDALIKMITNYASLANAKSLPICVRGVINSKKMLVASSPEELVSSNYKQLLDSDRAEPADISQFIDNLKKVTQPSQTVIVDCTSNENIANSYALWLEQGFNVTTPNKKAFSGPLSYYNQLRALQANTSPILLHEATVGAGLPVLSTLSNLVASGDHIKKIEGILSGTLSFLFAEFSSGSTTGPSFSDTVKVAKANGFTEPDPRDDLNGMDVARKATILARLSGANIEISDLKLQNIVPEPLLQLETSDEFMNQLPEFDAHFAELNAKALANNAVLRYVASLDFENKSYSVELKEFPKSHPFSGLSAGDNIISFTTEYFPNPLTIMGAGAGAQVTSYGIFCDILKIAENSRN